MKLEQKDPESIKILVSVRMAVRYRNQLAAEANGRGVSMNQLMLNALEAAVPPQ